MKKLSYTSKVITAATMANLAFSPLAMASSEQEDSKDHSFVAKSVPLEIPNPEYLAREYSLLIAKPETAPQARLTKEAMEASLQAQKDVEHVTLLLNARDLL